MKLIHSIARRTADAYWRIHDAAYAWNIDRRKHSWPCTMRQILIVGAESSGTTPIAKLLLNNGFLRFLVEGKQRWVWKAYMDIYQGQKTVRDFPRLQLFDGIKVPGFAAILDKYVEEFPNASLIYVVRDPRDVICSAFRTWKVRNREELCNVSWVKQTWLGITAKDPIERLALRWRRYLEVSRTVPNVNYVRYEDFCADKVGYITKIAASFDVPLDLGRVHRICDEQASHASARDYAPSGVGAWQRGEFLNRDDLQRIEDRCGDFMREWKYL